MKNQVFILSLFLFTIAAPAFAQSSNDPVLQGYYDRRENEMQRLKRWDDDVAQSQKVGGSIDLNMVAGQKAAVQNQIDYWDKKIKDYQAAAVVTPVAAPVITTKTLSAPTDNSCPVSPGSLQTLLAAPPVKKVITPALQVEVQGNFNVGTPAQWFACITSLEAKMTGESERSIVKSHHHWINGKDRFGLACDYKNRDEPSLNRGGLVFAFLSEQGFESITAPTFNGDGKLLLPKPALEFVDHGKTYDLSFGIANIIKIQPASKNVEYARNIAKYKRALGGSMIEMKKIADNSPQVSNLKACVMDQVNNYLNNLQRESNGVRTPPAACEFISKATP